MKKALKYFFAITICFTLIGCGKNNEEKNRELTNSEIVDKVNDCDWYLQNNIYLETRLELYDRLFAYPMFVIDRNQETGEVESILYRELLSKDKNKIIYSSSDEQLATKEYIESAKKKLANLGITLEDLMRYATSDYKHTNNIE